MAGMVNNILVLHLELNLGRGPLLAPPGYAKSGGVLALSEEPPISFPSQNAREE
jgi:hypothetical protein